MTIEWAVTANGRSSMLLSERGRSDAEVLEDRLARLNGDSLFAISLWRLPEGVPFDLVDLQRSEHDYIQVGGAPECFTVEISQSSANGRKQSVIGREVSPRSRQTRTVSWDKFATEVFANEVFTLVEVQALFCFYLKHETVPEGYARRDLAD